MDNRERANMLDCSAGGHGVAQNQGADPTVDRAHSDKEGILGWCRRKAVDYFVSPLLKSSHPPWYDARGVSVGLAVGFAVPVGAQVAVLGVLRTVLRFNFVSAVAFSFVSNPFNMIPLYYGYYLLGSWVIGKHPHMDFCLFQKLMSPIVESGYFWEALGSFLELSREILTAWFVAAAILATVSSVLGYVITHRIQMARAKRRIGKLEERYERILQEFDEKN